MDVAGNIRLVLVDSQQIIVECLKDRLNTEPGLSVVGAAVNSDEGVGIVDDLMPDLVMTDLELPGRGVFEAICDLRSRHRQLKFLILTDIRSDILLAHALQVRVNGYMLKSEGVSKVVEAIRTIATGLPYFSDAVRSKLEFNHDQNAYVLKGTHAAGDLTPRQLEVLRHLARGASVKEVAKLMHLSQKSVDSHKYRIMNKLGIHDRVDLTRFAIREQIIQA